MSGIVIDGTRVSSLRTFSSMMREDEGDPGIDPTIESSLSTLSSLAEKY